MSELHHNEADDLRQQLNAARRAMVRATGWEMDEVDRLIQKERSR